MEFLSFLQRFDEIGLLAIRLAIGIIFFVHGRPKLSGAKDMAQSMGKPQMAPFFVFLGIAEILGSIAMIIGFLTQFAAVGLSIIMIGAIRLKMVTLKTPFTSHESTGWEFDFLIFCSCIGLLFSGPGTISLDQLLFVI